MKKKKTHAKEEQSHAQDSIYMIRQFAYVHGVAGISLLLGKNKEYKNCGYNTVSLTLKNAATTSYNLKNPNHGKIGLYIWNRPKPPLHGLSLSKSPIKNHAILFGVGLGRQTESNKTKLHKTQHNQISVNSNLMGCMHQMLILKVMKIRQGCYESNSYGWIWDRCTRWMAFWGRVAIVIITTFLMRIFLKLLNYYMTI